MWFTWDDHPVEVEIIEDRGLLGMGGRRLYGIRWEREFEGPVQFEMPEDELTLVEQPLAPQPA